ncbi:hypothetical protein Dimus_015830 [Dionaea muscipula]
MDLEKIFQVVSEKGGGHVGQSFQVMVDPTSGAAGPSEAPKKVVRTRRTKKDTPKVVDVGDKKEAPTEGTVGGTPESEVVASKDKPKPKAKPKKMVMVSPAIGENVLEEEEARDDGDDKVEETGDAQLHLRTRRRLRKTSVLVPAAEDNEETQSEETVSQLVSGSDVVKEGQEKKRHQKQSTRTGPNAKKDRIDKEKIPLVEEEIETAEEPDVDTSSSPTFDELNKKVHELLARPFFSGVVEERRDEGGPEQERGVEEVSEADEEEEVKERKSRRRGTSTSEGRRRCGGNPSFL